MKTEPAPEETLEQKTGRIAGILSSDRFPTGERAALRRMAPGYPPPLSFYRFAFSHLPAGWERNADDWTALVAGLALMSPNAFNTSIGLGRALAEAGYSELRLERLLSAENVVRRTLFLRAVRFLSVHAKPFNWGEGARFLLTGSDRQATVNYRIARDFYSIIDKE